MFDKNVKSGSRRPINYGSTGSKTPIAHGSLKFYRNTLRWRVSASFYLIAMLCAHWFYFPAVQLPVRGGGGRHLRLCRQVPDSDAGPTGSPAHDTTGVSPFNYPTVSGNQSMHGYRVLLIRDPNFSIPDPGSKRHWISGYRIRIRNKECKYF